jgi:C4-dicarboxylate-specific signal transduction histidine kinase
LQASPKELRDSNNIVQGLVIDITKTKKQALDIEEKQKIVNHQIKLASLGELAAGVGHEINNPLAVISNVIEKLQDKELISSLTDEKYDWLLRMAVDASKRIATITDGLRTFSRTDSTELGAFRLNDSLQATLDLVEGLSVHKRIDIRFKQEQKDCVIYGNSGRMDQVIMNLLSNSIDALEGKEDAVIEVELRHKGEICELSVKDNGSGIPEEHRSRVFDPFYTSKEIGKGTGIGLSLAHSIVAEHEGSIKFRTSDAGTVFFVELPLYQGERG